MNAEAMTRDLYIYYRVRSEHADLLLEKVRAMHQSLFRECAIVGQLKRRPEANDGRHTWMEVYLAIPDGFETMLERAVAQAGLSALIDGERHTEHFLDYTKCA
jgi:hypothetical protein